MGHQYTGANAFPADFTIPDDLDDDKAATFNVGFEALGDRTVFNKTAHAAYLANKSPRMRLTQFLTSGTYTPDAASRIVAAWVWGCGGGGAGGNGAVSSDDFDRWIAGGGGGGGALIGSRPVPITPGTTYNIDIGAGGATNSGSGLTGNDGGDTIFRNGATNLAVFMGAQGGRGSVGGKIVTDWVHYVMGGMPVRDMTGMFIGPSNQGIRCDASDVVGSPFGYLNNGQHSIYIPMQPGQGGHGAGGIAATVGSAGARNSHGRNGGGTGGSQGADVDTTKRGGGGGGGGGAGPFGDGGDGGGGGTAVSIAIGGGIAAANSGAGGGGGGSAGYDAGGAGVSGNWGGAGGSGLLYLVTVEESP